MKLLNGKLVFTFLVAGYFRLNHIVFEPLEGEEDISHLKRVRVFYQHEWRISFPDVDGFIVGDYNWGREGSGLQRQSAEGQHQETR